MNDTTLEKLFLESINELAVYNKLQGISEDQIYNWRKGRKKYTRGEMLDVLSQLGIITITINKS
jgi:uncharacterized protein YnzC (UPF0291/DUF896 family)